MYIMDNSTMCRNQYSYHSFLGIMHNMPNTIMVTSIEVSINEAARFLGYNLFEKTFLNYINKHNEKNN